MQEFFEKNKRGIIGTTIFHLVVVLIILFLGFKTPFPPPGEEGIIINFGTDEDGFGITQAAQQATPPPPAARPAPRTETEERILTQDIEEAPSLPTPQRQEQRQPERPQPVAEPTPEPIVAETVPEAKPEPVPERRPNPNALFPGRTTTGDPGSNEGETTGPGNQGRVTGSTESPHRMGGDTGTPDGISFSLSGRNPSSLPLPVYTHNVEGIVVVEVRVNRKGDVTSARPGVRGTTIQNINLHEAAKRAAERARFDVSESSPEIQVGTITYHFRLQ
jgi:colicin import membrane protein